MREPIIDKDSFWADVVNLLGFRSLIRTPKPKPEINPLPVAGLPDRDDD